MKTNEMDKLIKQALSEEEMEFYNQLDEQSMPEMVGGLFQGKMKWLNIMMLTGMMIVFAGAVYCVVEFLSATDTIMAIKWGAASVFFWIATGFMKLLQFMQMDKNAILREMKKIELQLAVLAGKMDKRN